MPNKLSTGTYQIISLLEGEPTVGLAPLSPILSAPPPTSEPLQRSGAQLWKITQQADGQSYRFAIGGYKYTGVSEDGLIVATTDPKLNNPWLVHYDARFDAYLIHPCSNDYVGWGVPSYRPEITLEFSYPNPDDLSEQTESNLFRFIHVSNE